jgi:retinol dehydrogenase-12
VILACRNVEKGAQAKAELQREFGTDESITVEQLDLASFASIRSFAARISEKFDHVDALMNNAGIMFAPRCTTEDGFDLTWQTNFLGPFLLTSLLLPLLRKSPNARIVNVSSVVHWLGKIFLDDVNLFNMTELLYREHACELNFFDDSVCMRDRTHALRNRLSIKTG